jgi:hypothetical protein
MAAFTNYLEDKVMDHLFGGSAYTAPTWYVGLFTVAPSDSTVATGDPLAYSGEVSGGSYVREVVAWTVTGSGTAQAVNTSSIEWDAATADWGTVTHAGIFDALTAGNLGAQVQLTKSDFSTANPKTVNDGDVFKIDSGNLKVTLD